MCPGKITKEWIESKWVLVDVKATPPNSTIVIDTGDFSDPVSYHGQAERLVKRKYKTVADKKVFDSSEPIHVRVECPGYQTIEKTVVIDDDPMELSFRLDRLR